MAKLKLEIVPERRNAIMNAWQEFATDASFAGMTLAEFKAATAPVVEVREQIELGLVKLAGLRRMRNAHDQELWAKMLAVVDMVRGDPNYGPDSPLYRAIGFIAKSERASGLTTKKKAAEATTSAEQAPQPPPPPASSDDA